MKLPYVTKDPGRADKVGNLVEAAEGFEDEQDEVRWESREN